jgi:hypothetical protein
MWIVAPQILKFCQLTCLDTLKVAMLKKIQISGREHNSKMYGIVNFFDLSSYMSQKMVFINFYLRRHTVLIQIIK